MKPRSARFEFIPLIDVMLLLLATFALFACTLIPIQSVEAKMPIATCCGGKNATMPPMLTQASGGSLVYVDHEPYQMGELPKLLFAYKQLCEVADAEPRLVVSGDDNARFGQILTIIDQAKLLGITQMSIETFYRETGR